MLFTAQKPDERTATTAAPRRVVVTGAGIITAHGTGWAQNSEGFRTGRIGLKPVTLFDTSRQRVHHAGQVELPEALPPTRLSPGRVRHMARAGHLLIHAGAECLTQAGWSADDESSKAPKTAICLGTSSGGMTFGELFYQDTERKDADPGLQRMRVLQYPAHGQARDLGIAFGLNGPVTIISNACASGSNALGEAWRLVRTGRADRALAGGFDALAQLVFAGFDSLQSLSAETPTPFDVNRAGLALGEGAALLALEPFETAQARGAAILGEITGYAAATDLHHLTQPHPEGFTAIRTMSGACEMAGVDPAEIDYINAHGTGTPRNDIAELQAINAWAGDAAPRIAVSSTKAGIGHLLGAAGSVEAVVCLMALNGGWIPPNANLPDPEPGCRFQLPTGPTVAPVKCCLSNSFGFGGSNASIIFQKPGLEPEPISTHSPA